MKFKKGKKVLSLVLAALMVLSVMPTSMLIQKANAATAFEGGKEVADGTWKGWTWSVFGSGTAVANNTIKENSDGSVTLESSGKKGKIASKNEGIDFLYYKIENGKDFTITTKMTVDDFTKENQQAMGLMARAAVGEHGNSKDVDPLNSAFIGEVTKTDVFAASYRTSNTAFSTYEKSTDAQPTVEVGKTYDLAIQKIGDSLILSKDGVVYNEGKASEIFTGDAMYVGVFTSRLAKATFKDTTLTVTDTNSDVVVKDVTKPSKQEYVQGNTYNDIDLAGFSANVTLGGVEKTITAKDCRIEVPDFSKITDSGKIVLDYFGTKIEIPVKVIKEVVTDIKVDYNPIKTDYLLDETIDLTGLEGNVVYNSGVTKKLQDLIAAGDANTTVSYDFSKAGKTQVTITHTHGDVTKEYKFDVNVSDAKVTKIELAGPNRTTFYKDVVYDVDAYRDGVLVTAEYSDGSSKVLSAGFAVEANGDALDTTKTGKYTYVVTYGGKTAEYTLEVIERTVQSLEVTKIPDKTTYLKGEDFSADGLQVYAVYDSEEKVKVESPKVDSSAFNKDEAGEYKIVVSAEVDGKALSTEFTAAVRDKIDYKYNDLEWNAVTFGQSTANAEKATVTDNEDGSKTITVEAKEGVGKCTDDGQDGISYYYTVLDPTKDNFEITAKIKVDYFITKKSADNQEGFGIMVRDSIGPDGDASIYCSNAMSVGGYYGAFNVFGRYGVASADDASGKVNYTLVNKGKSEKVTEAAPKTFTLTLKKDNTGVYATMLDEAGNAVNKIDGSKTWYLPADTFEKIEDSKMYIGFMAARGAKIEVNSNDIEVKITSKAADAPQTFAPVNATKPTVTQASLRETADEDYEYKVTVNTKGLLTVKQDGKTLASQQVVEAGTYSYPTKLTVGNNKFQIQFEPDATQNINPKDTIIQNNTVVRKIYASVETPLYVSANGSKSGNGTIENPLDIQTALTFCQAGQAIYVKGGTYNLSSSVVIKKYNNGTAKDMKMLVADPDNTEDVVFDFAGNDGKATGNTFDVSGDYWYVEGIKFLNGGGVRVGGNHNILKNCDFAGHTNSGLSISRTDGATEQKDWPSYNQIISCNAYNNRDKSDNNADGFAAKLTCGVGNVFKYCVAAYNADDGWDLFSKSGTGAIGEVEIYDSVCYANGYVIEDGKLVKTKGDGNGFKMGGSGIAVNHKVYNSYSFGNAANGFTNNSDPMGEYINCTGYNNGGSNLELHTYTGATAQFVVENFKSFADNSWENEETLAALTSTEKDAEADIMNMIKSSSNFLYDKETGKSVNADGVELTAANFLSLAEFKDYLLGGIEAIQRNEDGSINLGNFLKYTDAADNGTDTPAGSDTSITTPDTGDRVMKVLIPLIIVMVIAVAGIVYVAVSSKKKKEDK